MNPSVFVIAGFVIGWLISEAVKEIKFRLEMRKSDRQFKQWLEQQGTKNRKS